MEFSANAVRAGSDTKHDLMVQLELGGDAREVEIHSKVEKKFGEAIREDVEQVLDEFGIRGVKIQIDDLGAWDFAVKARVRTAVKRALAQKEANQHELFIQDHVLCPGECPWKNRQRRNLWSRLFDL